MDTLTDLLEQAAVLLARAVADPVAGVPDAVLLSNTGAIEQAGRLVDALRIRHAAEITARSRPELGTDGLAVRQGHRSGAALMAVVTRVSEREVRRRIMLGQAVAERVSLTGELLPAEFPAVATAIRSGVVGVDAVEGIIRCLRQAERAATVEDRDVAEGFLVGEAGHLPADLVVLQARVWRERLDPDGAKPREDALTGDRRFTIGPDKAGELTRFWGQTDPINAALIRIALDRHGNPRRTPAFLAEDDQNTIDGETDPEGYRPVGEVKDPRTPGQRAHDILFGLLKAGVEAENTGISRHSTTTIVATVTLADLQKGTGPAWLDGVGEPVSAATVREKLCDAQVRTLILGAEGEVLYLGRDARLFSPTQRIAAGVRDGGCVFPGCTAPPSWCEVHHVLPFAEDGPTDIDNAALLCAFHHHVIHNGDWRMRMVHGRPQILAPPWANPDRIWDTVSRARVGLATTRMRV